MMAAALANRGDPRNFACHNCGQTGTLPAKLPPDPKANVEHAAGLDIIQINAERSSLSVPWSADGSNPKHEKRHIY